MFVLYVFLNHCDVIWYKDRLDHGEKDRLHFVSKKVNKKSNLRRLSNKEFKQGSRV